MKARPEYIDVQCLLILIYEYMGERSSINENRTVKYWLMLLFCVVINECMGKFVVKVKEIAGKKKFILVSVIILRSIDVRCVSQMLDQKNIQQIFKRFN